MQSRCYCTVVGQFETAQRHLKLRAIVTGRTRSVASTRAGVRQPTGVSTSDTGRCSFATPDTMIGGDNFVSCIMHNVNSRIVSLQFSNNGNYNCCLSCLRKGLEASSPRSISSSRRRCPNVFEKCMPVLRHSARRSLPS